MNTRETEVWDLVGKAAGRIRRFFEAMSQGHDFGIEPGPYAEPWKVEFQRAAAPTYAKTCPWEYLLGLSKAYEELADLMDSEVSPDDLKTSESMRSASSSYALLRPRRYSHGHVLA